MSEKTPQDYADELIRMYRENASIIREKPLVALPTAASAPIFTDGTGGVQVNVTTLRRLYPVKNAMVTVFTGKPESKNVIETDMTNESGKSKVFYLKTPPRADSQKAENNGVLPYASYNISVQSDGYVQQIAMNVPVFSGVLSVQGIDLLPITAAGGHIAPQVIEEDNSYDL